MKPNKFNRVVAVMLTLVMTSLMITPVPAASKHEQTDKKTDSKRNPAGVRASLLESIKADDAEKEFSREELEQMRTALLELVDGNQEVSTLLSAQGKEKIRNFGSKEGEDSFAETRDQILKMSAQELSNLRKAINPSKLQAKIAHSRSALSEFKNSIRRDFSGSAERGILPGIDSYCGAPVSTEAIIAADAIFFAAETVRDLAQNACNQVAVAVVLGNGGGANTRLACNVSDGIYLIAKAANQALHFCDDDYAASVGQASFDRLGHIHEDIEDIKANDNSNYSAIISNATTNTGTITAAVTTAKTAIVNNDNANTGIIKTAVSEAQTAVIKAGDANSAAIMANDDKNKNTIVASDNTNTAAIVANANANTAAILANANANKIELVRLNIAADLASTDGSVLVGAFMLPTADGGYLELVRAVVVQAITKLAGSSTSAANALLAQGDAFRNAGDYKNAYAYYRRAYKTAVK